MAGYFLAPGETLGPLGRLQAPTQPYVLVVQADGNLVLYRDDISKALWASHTVGCIADHLTMQSDGNLVLYSVIGQAVWASGTYGNPGARAILSDSGTLAVVARDGRILWQSPGGSSAPALFAPVSVSWGPGRQDVFATGPGGALLHRWYDGTWHGWESLGGVLTSAPTVASWAQGRLDVFGRGTDGALWHKWYDGTWHDWEFLGGGLTTAPAATAWGNGRLDVVVRGTDGALWHKWYDRTWHDWESLGGGIFQESAPAMASSGPGHLDIAVRGTDERLYHRQFDGTGWHGWHQIGPVIKSAPIVVSPAPGYIAVAAMGENSTYGSTSLHGQTWSGWTTAGSLSPQSLAHALARPGMHPADMTPAAEGAARRPLPIIQTAMGNAYCDRQYAGCCDEAEKIENEFLRNLQYTICNAAKTKCYAEAYGQSITDWFGQAFKNVSDWMAQHPVATVAIIVVAAVAVTIVFPPAGPFVWSVAVL